MELSENTLGSDNSNTEFQGIEITREMIDAQVKMIEISEYAKTKAYKDYLTTVYKNSLKKLELRKGIDSVFEKMNNGCYPGYRTGLQEELKEMLEHEKFGERLTAQETVGLFITLSPEPEEGLIEKLVEEVNKIFKKLKSGILEYYYVYEQTGTIKKNNVGYHPHCHILVLLDKSVQSGERGKMTKYFEDKFRKFKTKSESYLQIKAVSQKSFPEKIKYLLGKKDKSKLENVEADREFRKMNDLKAIYTNKEIEW